MAKKAKKKATRRNSSHSQNPLSQKVPRHEAVWLEGPVPAGYWNYADNQRRYIIWLGRKLGFRKLEDYYRLVTDDFKQNRGGGVLLHCWNSSAVRAVMETFPDQDWNEWQFVSCPRSFWKDRKNHRRYMKWLGETLGIEKPDDWYRVTNYDFRKNKGGAFLLHYDSTISDAVKAYLPKHRWNEWMFGKTPKNFWDNCDNRVRYMKWLGRKLGFRKLDDWYKVTREDFEGGFGNQLIKHYNGSPLAAVMDCYPNHKWLEWKFARVPVGFWKKKANRERYFEWLAKELKLKTEADWAGVRRRHLKQNYGGGLLQAYLSIETLLRKVGRRAGKIPLRKKSARRKKKPAVRRR